MTERDLISAVKAGDRESFNKLYELHWVNLVSYAALVAGEKCAKDIVHDIFLKVWLNRASLQEKETLRPYLMRSVHNLALNVLRNAGNLDFVESYTDSQIDFRVASEADPDKSEIVRRLYDKDIATQIDQAVEQLPERCREIFRRSYVDGKSHKEIAEEMGITLSTVDNQIYKALKILRSVLSENIFLLLLLFFTK